MVCSGKMMSEAYDVTMSIRSEQCCFIDLYVGSVSQVFKPLAVTFIILLGNVCVHHYKNSFTCYKLVANVSKCCGQYLQPICYKFHLKKL